MNRSYLIFFSSLVCFAIISSCKPEVSAPDISNIPVDYDIIRFEQILYEMDTSRMLESLEKVERQYPEFSRIYFTQILPLENLESQSDFYNSIRKYIDDEEVLKLTDTVQQVFGAFEDEKAKLDQAFGYLKYYFPGYQLPNIYTFVSYFGYQCFIFEDGPKDGIGLGLDMFLGSDYPYKNLDPTNPAFSDYLTLYFNKDHIPRRIIEQILDDKLGKPGGSKLIDHMIHNGKKLYLIQKCLPHDKQGRIHEYADDQMKWCESNETSIWTFFVDKEYLYNTDLTMINRYTRSAPTSRNMPAESPGRTANYLGLKIVEAYMKKFPETTIQELIAMKDGTVFLQKSKYKPPRNGAK